MATYQGYVRTREDAILLFEACQLDVLPKILRRLSRKERKVLISPGAVFVWDELEAGIQRWTDGRLWGSIALSETFIIRREMERKVRRTSIVDESDALDAHGKTNPRGRDLDLQTDDGATDGYIYKPNGLVRKSMTITTSGRQLHLVTYHNPSRGNSPDLPTPTSD
ncbi:gluconate transport inducer 1/Pac2, partial [Leptodontidium sp. MPI-SDFR-AT-0119]